MKTSIIVLAHGSKINSGNDGLFKIVEMLKVTNKWDSVEPGFLQLAEPDLAGAISKVVNEGAKRVVIIPLLLFNGNHVRKDIPFEIENQKKMYPGVEFLYAGNLGADERIAQIATDRINDVLIKSNNGNSSQYEQFAASYNTNPDSIINESFETIDKLLDLIGINDMPEIYKPIIKRIIHTTGEPEYAKSIIISDGAVEAGIKAIRDGKSIVTDVNMVKSGISKKILNDFCGNIECKIADQDVADKAKKTGQTRAITAMNESITEMENGIVAIGNAPSALFHVVDLVKHGKANPALIVGVPVGFVGAAESKAVLRMTKIPHITNIGRKGGSPVAVTIVNALLNMARDPELTIDY